MNNFLRPYVFPTAQWDFTQLILTCRLLKVYNQNVIFGKCIGI